MADVPAHAARLAMKGMSGEMIDCTVNMYRNGRNVLWFCVHSSDIPCIVDKHLDFFFFFFWVLLFLQHLIETEEPINSPMRPVDRHRVPVHRHKVSTYRGSAGLRLEPAKDSLAGGA